MITVSAVPKPAINLFSTRGGAGRIAQSKQLDKSSGMTVYLWNDGIVYPSFMP